MKNGRREIALAASGIILGASIAAPAAGTALMAQQSNQRIVVDGKSVQIEAYSINGNNYAKLRGIYTTKITNRITPDRRLAVRPTGRRHHPL